MNLHERLIEINNYNKNSKTESHTNVNIPEELIEGLSQRIHSQLIAELGPELYFHVEDPEKLKDKVQHKLVELINKEPIALNASEKAGLIEIILNDIIGYGPLEDLLNDPEITEIMVNGAHSVYIEKNGKIYSTQKKFIDDDHLRRIIEKIVAQVGRRIDESVPMVDARLPDGSRVNAVIPPISLTGPKLTIRKFAADPYKVNNLINFKTMSQKVADFLEVCVKGRLNILVSGGTGSGKTTTLNVLSDYLPIDERIITIEDAVELQLHQEHVIQLESRPANIEKQGEVTIRDLVRNALRMRPDRIVVGEVRGGEALDMLQAMNTGHDGSLSTIHANSPRDVLSRLETMVLMSGMDLPVRAIREQVSSAIDLIVHQSRLRDGSRKITHITEVQGMEGDIITLQDIFLFDFSQGLDEKGNFKGEIKPTGIRPKFMKQLEDQGYSLDAEIFQLEGNQQ